MAVQQAKEVAVVVRLNKPVLLSVIIPVLNEGCGIEGFLAALPLREDAVVEYIFVDGGSIDGTLTKLISFVSTNSSCSLLSSEKGRAVQLNTGAEIARGRTLVFLHADTYLPADFFQLLTRFGDQKNSWGRFDVRLNHAGKAYKVISWFINARSRLTGIATGDQCIFMNATLFTKVSGFSELPLMEDIELSKRLKRISRPVCLSSRVLTSARKWEKEGLINTVLLMWRLRFLYALGCSPEKLVKRYYSS